MKGLGQSHTAHGRDTGGGNTPGSLNPSHLPNGGRRYGGGGDPEQCTVGSQSWLALRDYLLFARSWPVGTSRYVVLMAGFLRYLAAGRVQSHGGELCGLILGPEG